MRSCGTRAQPDATILPEGIRLSQDQSSRMLPSSLAPALLLGALGFAANWFRIPLFANIDLIFGSFFVMTAVIRYGTGAGVIASLIAGSCTLLIWKHPWAMALLTAEAAFLGWRIRQRGQSILLIHDMTFWCCCGVPLVWLLYYFVGGETAAFTHLIASKQFVNGIFNALFASLFQLILRRMQESESAQLPTLHHIVFTVMVSLVLVPVLVLIVIDVRQSVREKSQHLSRDTARASMIARGVVSLWLEDHHGVIETLARQVGDPDQVTQRQMQQSVEAVLGATSSFKRMGVLNRDGITIAYSPLRDDLGRSTLGVDYSNRPYLKGLKGRKGSYVSNVFTGLIGKPVPIVALITPLAVKGENKGIAVGIIRTEDILKYLKGIADSDAVSITVLDRRDQVISSTRSDLSLMMPYQRKPGGTVVAVGNGVTCWTPPASEGTTAIERHRASFYIKEATLTPAIPWKVIVESSHAPVVDALQADTALSLDMLAVLILIVVPLSQLICRRLTADLVTLREETQRLPTLVREGRGVSLPSSTIRDVAGLIENFRETSAALGQQYQSLDNLNSVLEKRVREAETRFKTMFENHSAVMLLLEPHSGLVVDANRTASQFYGYPIERLREMELGQISEPPALPETAGKEEACIASHRLADGQTRTVEVYATAISVGSESLIFAIILDITKRRLAEQALAEHRDNLEHQVLARTASLSLSNRQLEKEIEEHKKTEQQLRAHQQKLSDLAMELSFAEEWERNRIASELHDQVGQRLLLGKMKLELLANLLPDRVQEEDVTEIRCLVEQTLKDIRSLTFQIRPPLLATAGLEPAVQWLGEELGEDFGLQLEFLDDRQPKQLPYEVRCVVFQAVRELLLNVVKHAGTKRAQVSLRREGEFLLVAVADNGSGMDSTGHHTQPRKEGGFGLFNVQQRMEYLGGRVTTESASGEGTRITIAVPLQGSRRNREGDCHAEHPAC